MGPSPPYRPGAPSVAEVAAGAVVFDRSGQLVLLLHHRSQDRWCFPKGHVEPGESLLDAARREVEEETGLRDLEFGEELCEQHYRFFDAKGNRNVLKTSVYFEATAPASKVALEPLFDQHRWTTLNEADVLVAFDNDRAVLEAARRRRVQRPATRPD